MSIEQSEKGTSSRDLASQHWGGLFLQRVNEIPLEVVHLTEVELETHFRPTTHDYFLRKNFWKKTTEAKETGATNLETKDIYDGVCTRQHFYTVVMKNPYRLAWILVPIQAHTDLIEESFYFAIKKVRDELLTMPVSEKTAPAIMKALQFFADRHLGPMLQKMDINQKTLNMNVDATSQMRDALSADALQDKIEALQSKIKTVKQIEAPVDEEDNEQS